MGLFGFFKNRPNPAVLTASFPQAPSDELSAVDKERIVVQRITAQDMHQFTNMPYQWNSEIKKFVDPNGHPFAYLDIVGQNITIAQSELLKINKQLSGDIVLLPAVPKNISIPVEDIVFKPSNKNGYTRLICTPYTFTGKISKYPISLSFMTDLENNSETTHGDLFYGQDGEVKKATIYFWRKQRGYFFYYGSVEHELGLSKIEVHNVQGQRNVIYKNKYFLSRGSSETR